MSHLHLPDGLVPFWLWMGALGLVVLLLAWTERKVPPQRVAYQGALGGLMMAAMAIPLGPLDYHLTLAGPVGVLLGPAGAFPVGFVVGATLAFVGHGGFTVIGLNALLLGSAASVAWMLFGPLSRRLPAGWALAVASAGGHVVSGGLWWIVVVLTLRQGGSGTATVTAAIPRFELFGAVALSLWLAGTLAESAIAFGIGRFLSRVHPALLALPAADRADAGRSG